MSGVVGMVAAQDLVIFVYSHCSVINNHNTVDKGEKVEQPGYNSVTESSFNESYTCVWWKLSSPIS